MSKSLAETANEQSEVDWIEDDWDENLVEFDHEKSFLCRTCYAELPSTHHGRCPFCGERP